MEYIEQVAAVVWLFDIHNLQRTKRDGHTPVRHSRDHKNIRSSCLNHLRCESGLDGTTVDSGHH